MQIKHRIDNTEYLGEAVFSKDIELYDSYGPYHVKARAHRLYRGLPAKKPAAKPIKIFKKTNAFWVYDTNQRELMQEVDNGNN